MSRLSPSPLPYPVPLPRSRPLLSLHLERLLIATLPWLVAMERNGWDSVEGEEREGIANCRRWLAAHATGCGITRVMRQEIEDLEQLLDDALSHRQRPRRRRLAMLRTGREDQ